MFESNVFGRYVFERHRRTPAFCTWLMLQFVAVTLWMMCFIALVRTSQWGWWAILGITPIQVNQASTWIVFMAGLAVSVVSTHMGWAEQYENRR